MPPTLRYIIYILFFQTTPKYLKPIFNHPISIYLSHRPPKNRFFWGTTYSPPGRLAIPRVLRPVVSLFANVFPYGIAYFQRLLLLFSGSLSQKKQAISCSRSDPLHGLLDVVKCFGDENHQWVRGTVGSTCEM